MNKEELLARAKKGKRESKTLDFKEEFDVDSIGAWCEVVKDVVAMANSGGGVITFGVKNNGIASKKDVAHIVAYDPAKVTDKIAKYTARQFADFEIQAVGRFGRKVPAMFVESTTTPMVFTKAGTYRDHRGKEKVAFQQGTVYFRHGAKSEPATEADLHTFIERRVESVRHEWLSGIKKVTAAPAGSSVHVYEPEGSTTSAVQTRVQVVNDPSAPPVRLAGGDDDYPHRTKDVVAEVNRQLKNKVQINAHDTKCLQKVYNLKDQHPELMYKPFANAAPQYSDGYVDWLVKSWKKNNDFFSSVREQYRAMHST